MSFGRFVSDITLLRSGFLPLTEIKGREDLGVIMAGTTLPSTTVLMSSLDALNKAPEVSPQNSS